MKQILGVFFILLLAIGILYVVKFHPEALQGDFSHIRETTPMPSSLPIISIRGINFRLLLAKTPEEQQKGLGFRDSLPQDEGMLFLFDHPDYQAFWMKGMRFPLDIIYIRDNKIVTIFQKMPNPPTENAAVEILKPSEPADTVLEINSGLSAKYDFEVGDEVKISL
jgi:uncharacterized protein